MQTFNLALSLPRDVLEGVGRVTAEWSFLEWQVQSLIWKLLGIGSKEGRIITTQMNIRPKTEILQLLASFKISDAQTQNALKDVISEISKITEARNQIIHGTWAQDGQGNYYLLWYRGKNENRITGKAITVTAPEVHGLADSLRVINAAFIGARVKIEAQLGPLPHIQL